jgi:hypothetical protein
MPFAALALQPPEMLPPDDPGAILGPKYSVDRLVDVSRPLRGSGLG